MAEIATIKWRYFFGCSYSSNGFDRYYKAEINGVAVEKHCTKNTTRYCIGNMDEAKKKFKTESELLNALK
jgi:hypothetical protein